MDLVGAPALVPMLGGVQTGVSEDGGPLFHALLELDGECKQGRIGQIESNESAVGECDVQGVLWFSQVPALARRYLAQETPYEAPGAFRVFEVKEEIPGDGHVVASQNKALNICCVQFTHFDRQS
jgi:hypothetical protein